MRVILGLDPGSRFTGFGLVAYRGDEIIHLDHGVLSIPLKLSFPEKLNYLVGQLSDLIGHHRPTDVVVEKIFLGKNVDSAFKLGHVRGVCLQQAAAVEAMVFEYAARSVKKAVTGHGGASKEQVHLLVTNLLKIHTAAKLDATDALALAICHARCLTTQIILDQNRSQVII